MSAPWYKVERYKDAPIPAQVTRATEHRVWVMEPLWNKPGFKEFQRHRNSRGDIYFPTYAEARDHIVARELQAYEIATERMNDAADLLARAEALPMDPPA